MNHFAFWGLWSAAALFVIINALASTWAAIIGNPTIVDLLATYIPLALAWYGLFKLVLEFIRSDNQRYANGIRKESEV